uniref:Uncharacterized protein n=1 Tax=Rhizophora mucronata TaxID=61149 RepID=A0A2P2QN68_RHIMU
MKGPARVRMDEIHYMGKFSFSPTLSRETKYIQSLFSFLTKIHFDCSLVIFLYYSKSNPRYWKNYPSSTLKFHEFQHEDI